MIGVSFLLLLSQAILRNVRLKRKQKHKSISNGSNIYDASTTHDGLAYQSVPEDIDGSITADEEDEGLSIGGGRLALVKNMDLN